MNTRIRTLQEFYKPKQFQFDSRIDNAHLLKYWRMAAQSLASPRTAGGRDGHRANCSWVRQVLFQKSEITQSNSLKRHKNK